MEFKIAGTLKKKLLKLAISGAESADNAKDKLAFLSIAMILYDKKVTKAKVKEVMTSSMKVLLGLAEKEEDGH